MRVPSDAPKNFIIQTTKYNYKKLRNSDGTININSDMFVAIRNILYGEINTALENLLIISDEEGNINKKPDKKYLIFSSEIIPESLIALTKFAFTCTLKIQMVN